MTFVPAKFSVYDIWWGERLVKNESVLTPRDFREFLELELDYVLCQLRLAISSGLPDWERLYRGWLLRIRWEITWHEFKHGDFGNV